MLTDKDLPGYLRIHCRTPVGLVHRDHWARIHDLAGRADDAAVIRAGKEWWRPEPAWADELAAAAERNQSA